MEQQGYKKPFGPPPQPFGGTDHHLPIVGHSDWRRELRRTILNRVVPRLSAIGTEGDASAPPSPAAVVTEALVVRFSDLVLAASVPSLLRSVEALCSDGVPVEAVVAQLMVPVARRLGDLWLADRLSFFDVTAALGRLQGLLRALGSDLDGDAPGLVRGKKVLLATVEGEQHVFGLSVVAAFFRRAGWAVTFEPRIAFADLLVLVRAERFTAIGLTVANDRFLDGLPGQVEALRGASLNGAVTLLAGGPAFLYDADLHRRIGVDAVAADATEAVQLAEALSGEGAAVRAVP